MKNNTVTPFRQTNAFAMTYGLLLGFWGILALSLMIGAMTDPARSLPAALTFYGSPVVAGYLTLRFRRRVSEPAEGFPFGRAFLFTFMMGVYASVVIAILAFAYLQFIDPMAVANAFAEVMSRPDIAEQMHSAGILTAMPGGANNWEEAVRQVPPSGYASMIIYLSMMASPIISAAIGFIARRHPQRIQ